MPLLFFFCSFVIDLHPSFASGTDPFVTRFGTPTSEPQHIPAVGTKERYETLSSSLVEPAMLNRLRAGLLRPSLSKMRLTHLVEFWTSSGDFVPGTTPEGRGSACTLNVG